MAPPAKRRSSKLHPVQRSRRGGLRSPTPPHTHAPRAPPAHAAHHAHAVCVHVPDHVPAHAVRQAQHPGAAVLLGGGAAHALLLLLLRLLQRRLLLLRQLHLAWLRLLLLPRGSKLQDHAAALARPLQLRLTRRRQRAAAGAAAPLRPPPLLGPFAAQRILSAGVAHQREAAAAAPHTAAHELARALSYPRLAAPRALLRGAACLFRARGQQHAAALARAGGAGIAAARVCQGQRALIRVVHHCCRLLCCPPRARD